MEVRDEDKLLGEMKSMLIYGQIECKARKAVRTVRYSLLQCYPYNEIPTSIFVVTICNKMCECA